ncbi:FGGY family carbohydrate kinase [Oryzicola mucosus]|uniref:Carbohydrate kinase n=1 Tax=Oryzicola mucosus TaxID=2767425 RepID=A0A8J6PKQ0_9HYPH|nr:FGGY family carbohydrate kinase [Oryzicola mucosus]MBD0415341.1 carbohydrate kinase [Oryzicola mucosus]
MSGLVFCLDSGTTAVKAAAFDRRGRLVATAQRPNSALRRSGEKVEQDMEVSRDDALAVLAECVAQAEGMPVGLIITGQGDGTWPLDAEKRPAGLAMTWLDGRARGLVSELTQANALAPIEDVTFSRPTAASQSMHLLWLAQHEPDRLERIAHTLRLKEWLFFCLTGELKAEPSALLPTWGDWRTGKLSPIVEQALGLPKGIDLLPEVLPVGACRAGLTPEAAKMTGLPENLPVLIGPGDVQSTLIGLGLGVAEGIERCSIFGTSAIHGCFMLDPAGMAERPAGMMVQPFALGEGYICFHPSFNGATLFEHLSHMTGRAPTGSAVEPVYSGLVLQPFFEPGGERAPYTTPHARGSILGLTAATTAAEIDWAGREALAFIARRSHEMMQSGPIGSVSGAIALGGGLAGDRAFAQFLATTTQSPVLRTTNGQAGLKGAGAIAAFHLFGLSRKDLTEGWLGAYDELIEPETGAVAEYAEAKYALFTRLVEAVSPHWDALARLDAMQKRIGLS